MSSVFNKNIIAVLPVFFENTKLWQSEKGIRLIMQSCKSAIQASTIDTVIVITDSTSVLDEIQTITGVSAYLLPLENGSRSIGSCLVPRGSLESLTYVEKTLRVKADSIFLLNFRNPAIPSDAIDRAVRYFGQRARPILISVKKAVDHPCQARTYYQIENLGFLHLFENEEYELPEFVKNRLQRSGPGLRHFVTKAFHFDWVRYGLPSGEPRSVYNRTREERGFRFSPTKKTAPYMWDDNASLWIYEDSQTARVIFSFNTQTLFDEVSGLKGHSKLRGASCSDGCRIPSLLLLQDEESCYHVSMNSVPEPPLYLRMFPVMYGDMYEDQAVETEITLLRQATPIPSLHVENAFGFAYFCLQFVQNGDFDLCEPSPPDENLWRIKYWSYIHGGGPMVNVETGKNIAGRQDFPDIFEPDGTFLIMKKDDISQVNKYLIDCDAEGFVLNENESANILSEDHLFRFVTMRERDNAKGPHVTI